MPFQIQFIDIFVTVSVLLTLVVACAIAHLIYITAREKYVEWQRLKKFAAELPEGERAAFWRVYRQTKRLPRRNTA